MGWREGAGWGGERGLGGGVSSRVVGPVIRPWAGSEERGGGRDGVERGGWVGGGVERGGWVGG